MSRRVWIPVIALAGAVLAGNAPWAPRDAPPLPREKSADAHAGAALLSVLPEGMVAIAGGSFDMGSGAIEQAFAIELCRSEPLGGACNSSWWLSESPQHVVTLEPFAIDRTEVTVGAWSRCVSAGACPTPGFAPGDPRRDRADLPVTFVTWEEAEHYCHWRGARLPTEAEWERAARGANGRRFPWGQTSDGKRCNHGALDTGSVVNASLVPGLIIAGIEDPSDGFAGLAPVGSFPAGATPEGIYDLAGNVSEWVEDTWYPYERPHSLSPAGSSTAALPRPPVSGSLPHITRGGSYRMPLVSTRGAARGLRLALVSRDPDVGFRCAADRAR